MLAFSDIHDKALIATAIAIGTRREDLVCIKRNDFVVCRNEDGQIDYATITYYESKKHRTRTVYVPSPETIQIIEMHLKTCRESEWLFPSPKLGKFRGKHLSSRHAYDVFNEHLLRAGISKSVDDIRPFHCLRATCYKICQSAGWSREKAAEHIGDTLQVADKHYGAPSVEEMKSVAIDKPLF